MFPHEQSHVHRSLPGWNSWNTFKLGINQTIVEGTAKALVELGLRDAGYNYLIMDDGWQNMTRSPEGRQQANTTRFPSGLNALSVKVHDLGLKLGIYRFAILLTDLGFWTPWLTLCPVTPVSTAVVSSLAVSGTRSWMPRRMPTGASTT